MEKWKHPHVLIFQRTQFQSKVFVSGWNPRFLEVSVPWGCFILRIPVSNRWTWGGPKKIGTLENFPWDSRLFFFWTIHFGDETNEVNHVQFQKKTYLGGGFKHFLFWPYLGNDPIWRSYFSDGLKPPTRYIIHSLKLYSKQRPPEKMLLQRQNDGWSIRFPWGGQAACLLGIHETRAMWKKQVNPRNSVALVVLVKGNVYLPKDADDLCENIRNMERYWRYT